MLTLDVDGTMTDNGIYIDENGIESKRYNAKDGVGIYELIKHGTKIGKCTTKWRQNDLNLPASACETVLFQEGDFPLRLILKVWANSEGLGKYG